MPKKSDNQLAFEASFHKSRNTAKDILSGLAEKKSDCRGAELVLRFEMIMRTKMLLAIQRVYARPEKLGSLVGYFKATEILFAIAGMRLTANAEELLSEFEGRLATAQIQLPKYPFPDKPPE